MIKSHYLQSYIQISKKMFWEHCNSFNSLQKNPLIDNGGVVVNSIAILYGRNILIRLQLLNINTHVCTYSIYMWLGIWFVHVFGSYWSKLSSIYWSKTLHYITWYIITYTSLLSEGDHKGFCTTSSFFSYKIKSLHNCKVVVFFFLKKDL